VRFDESLAVARAMSRSPMLPAGVEGVMEMAQLLPDELAVPAPTNCGPADPDAEPRCAGCA
jgi:hypothetical protein